MTLSAFLIVLILLLMLTIKPVVWVNLGLLGLSCVFYILSMKRKHEFVMGDVGVDMVEEYYNDNVWIDDEKKALKVLPKSQRLIRGPIPSDVFVKLTASGGKQAKLSEAEKSAVGKGKTSIWPNTS